MKQTHRLQTKTKETETKHDFSIYDIHRKKHVDVELHMQYGDMNEDDMIVFMQTLKKAIYFKLKLPNTVKMILPYKIKQARKNEHVNVFYIDDNNKVKNIEINHFKVIS